MKIYVASSWRNEYQPGVVSALREDGHDVYDFRGDDGFSWREVDPDWANWPSDIPKYLNGLTHPAAERGFTRDMTALEDCDVCVYVMPCGVSASWEAGWTVGAGRPTYVYVPGVREPDLIVKMATLVTNELAPIRAAIRALSTPALPTTEGIEQALAGISAAVNRHRGPNGEKAIALVHALNLALADAPEAVRLRASRSIAEDDAQGLIEAVMHFALGAVQ